MNFNCASGGLETCTHIPRRASHTSSMHIPRAHKAAWALKLPLYIVFILFEYTHVTLFTNLTPRAVQILWVVKQILKICVKKKARLGSNFTLKTTGEVHEAVGLFCFHMQVFEPTYLSTYAPPPHLYFCDNRHSMLLKKKKSWPQNQVGRPQHFTLCKAIKDLRGSVRPPDKLLSHSQGEVYNS